MWRLSLIMMEENDRIEQMQQRVFFKQTAELAAAVLEQTWSDDNKAIYIAKLLRAIAAVFGPGEFTREQIQMVNGAYNVVQEICHGSFNIDRLHHYITSEHFTKYISGEDDELIYTPDEGYRGSNNDPF